MNSVTIGDDVNAVMVLNDNAHVYNIYNIQYMDFIVVGAFNYILAFCPPHIHSRPALMIIRIARNWYEVVYRRVRRVGGAAFTGDKIIIWTPGKVTAISLKDALKGITTVLFTLETFIGRFGFINIGDTKYIYNRYNHLWDDPVYCALADFTQDSQFTPRERGTTPYPPVSTQYFDYPYTVDHYSGGDRYTFDMGHKWIVDVSDQATFMIVPIVYTVAGIKSIHAFADVDIRL